MTSRITILSGTNRTGSATRALADHVTSLYAAAGAQPTLLDLATIGPECFTPSSKQTVCSSLPRNTTGAFLAL